MDQNVNGVAPVQDGDEAEKEIAGSVELSQELLLGFNESPAGPSRSYVKPNSKTADDDDIPLVQTNLSISLSNLSNLSNLSGVIAEERGFMTTISSFQHGCKPRHLLPSLPNSFLIAGFEQNSGTGSQLCVARPPVEGRVKNQLLPRYWPRITDQELQQISGDSNSTIVPLFEKVLSASDAGRVGRLVLPKACAEAYFPPISQPEGHPLRIQDVKGNEWVLQFRFWPNNNSRMYVLEGVSPCIRSMQLQAGDTVTFSRIDPAGKLLMGFRKAPSSVSSRKDPLVTMNTSAFQALNASTKDICPRIIQKNFSCAGDNLLAASSLHPERKRRNIGPKSKRLLINSHDSLELRLTWEEVQDALRPPPSVKASTFSVEDHEFEEFEELPVFGKQSIFIIRPSGEYEQWSQCDCCLKWRKLPIDVLLPPKWTCQDSVNDSRRISCSAPDELSSREIESLLVMNKEFTKMRLSTSLKVVNETEPKELESARKTAAVGSNISDPGVSSVATTTKHPRHRPGCSCIVCIQPPSGKGKHKPTCGCNVCMTVKRRFKTLMMRKKKRQSELVEEIAPKNHSKPALKEEPEVESIPAQVVHSDNEKGAESEILFRCHCNFVSHENAEVIKKGLDLNCHPCQEHTSPSGVSMMSLLQEASLPLDTYLRQKGLQSLVSDQNAASVLVIPQLPREIMAQPHEDKGFSDAIQEQDEGNASNSEKDPRE